MKFISTFICSFIVFLCFSQTQLVEICDDEPSVTITYFVQSNYPTNLVWTLNGFTYQTEELTVVWDSVGVYNISVTSNSECPSDTQNLQIVVSECNKLIYYVPNAFTPDGDNHNNEFEPIFTEGFDPFDYHLTIFNRWGEIIFESYDATKGWNGYYGQMRCQDGVYIWKIEFGLQNNTDERKVILGHVVLIR